MDFNSVLNERELQNELVAHLKEQGFQCKEYVACSVGIADIVIDNAVIEVKHLLNRDVLFKAVGQAVLYQAAIGKLEAKVTFSHYDTSLFAPAIDALKRLDMELILWHPGDLLVFKPSRVWDVTNTYQVGDICWISSLCCADLLRYHGFWAIVTEACKHGCRVSVCGKSIFVAAQHLKRIELSIEENRNVKVIYERISQFAHRDDLVTTATGILEALGKKICFVADDIWLLEKVEELYL